MPLEQENIPAAEGVLLYYYFTPLSTRQIEEQQWYIDSCSELKLVGRVRVARDGVNATLGGNYQNLQKHAYQVAERYHTDSIDFKLTTSSGRKNEQCAIESKFNQLTVDIVKEVVTIGLDDLLEADGDVTAAPITARHASPVEFHRLLQNAANTETSGTENSDGNRKKETVLVDCRNIYETRIGHFEAEGVIAMNPGTRAFSDLPAWFENNAHKLAGKRVLMCCTGGIRCERASAYLRTLGNCFQGDDDVVQLRGGIERYLEEFGQEGYFKGKNFVFDERGESEGILHVLKDKEEQKEENLCTTRDTSTSDTIRGACCVCTTPWGDYNARARCDACRMLVLLCDTCHSKRGKEKEDDDGGEVRTQPTMLCELCQQRSINNAPNSIRQPETLPWYNNITTPSPPVTRARILCLHGFRQTARNFQGRTSALRRRLKQVAEFVFIDAPHTLPDIYKSTSTDQQEKTTLKIENEDSGAPLSIKSNGASSSPSDTSIHNQWEQKRLRRGWLLSPEQYNAPNSIPQNEDLDDEQYHRQIAGLKESLDIIDNVLDTQGPWDGILGFSQGASIASLLAARECRERTKRRFKFAISCSGYSSPLLSDKEQERTISMPSLHVYGATKQDRQISQPESKSLWEQFDATKRVLLRHNAGHVIPSTRLAAARIAEFIAWAKVEESKDL